MAIYDFLTINLKLETAEILPFYAAWIMLKLKRYFMRQAIYVDYIAFLLLVFLVPVFVISNQYDVN